MQLPRFPGRLGWPPRPLTAVAAAMLLCWCGLWLYLGVTELKLGPHRYDDFRYAANAIRGTFDQVIRFRYWHVWGLRLFYALLEDRIVAAAAYAALTHAALTGVAFYLGQRAGGALAGAFAALLLPFFPPLLNFISTPLTDPPCLLYAGLAIALCLPSQGMPVSPLRAGLAGLCCFASIKCKETGIAAVPVVFVLLGQDRSQRRALLRTWLMGAVSGQVILSVADWIIVGDPLVSLRFRVFEKYTGSLTGAPKVAKTGRNLMRDEWMQLLLNPGTRDFTLVGLAGIAVGIRRNLVVASLGLFGLCVMSFSAWVSWRYSGIDAHIRYLGPLALTLVVPAGWLLAEAWRAARLAPAPGRDEDANIGSWLFAGGTRDPSRWIGLVCGLALAWIAVRGLWAGADALLGAKVDYAGERAAYFLLPLVPALCLCAALAGRATWPRRAAVLAVLVALPMMAWPVTDRYMMRARRNMGTWQNLARHMDQAGLTTIQRYRTKEHHVQASLLRWRLLAFGSSRARFPKVVDLGPLSDADPEQLLLIDRTRKDALLEARAAGWKTLLSLRRSRRRLIVLHFDGK